MVRRSRTGQAVTMGKLKIERLMIIPVGAGKWATLLDHWDYSRITGTFDDNALTMTHIVSGSECDFTAHDCSPLRVLNRKLSDTFNVDEVTSKANEPDAVSISSAEDLGIRRILVGKIKLPPLHRHSLAGR